MVNYNPKTWFNLIFHSYSKQVLRTLWPALGFMAAFSFAVCFVVLQIFHIDPKNFPGSTTVHSLLGIVLGLFLVFRTNSAYDRWWEGRRMWGGLVNSTRNFALKLNSYLDKGNHDDREWFVYMIPNFIYAVKENLRKGVTLTLDETLAEISERDQRDSQRADSPLVRADDAVYLDTSGKTIEEVLQDIVTLVETRQKEDAAKGE